MIDYVAADFEKIGEFEWRHETGITFVTRPDQTLQSAIDEYRASLTNPPTPSQSDYAAAIQGLLDAKARERQYDGIHTAIGYRDDPNPNFAAEALALFNWRSDVWTYSSTELAKVMADQRPQPTVAEFMTELEAACSFVWPMQRPAMLGGQLPSE